MPPPHTSPRPMDCPYTPPPITNFPIYQSSGGKDLSLVIIPIDKKIIVSRMKPQNGFTRNSFVVCPIIYLYHDQIMMVSMIFDFKEMYKPYTYNKNAVTKQKD